MGVIKRGVLGGFSGRVANVVGGSWKGIAYMRSLPLSVANPRTEKQQAQRLKLTILMALAVQITNSIIKPFWNKMAVGMSGFNAFIKENVTSINTDNPNRIDDCSFSQGIIGAVTSLTRSLNGTTKVLTIEWDNTILPINAKLTDKVTCFVYNNYTSRVELVDVSGITRDDGGFTFTLSQVYSTGNIVAVILIFTSADGLHQSDDTQKTVSVSA